jgi:hypothetical protein
MSEKQIREELEALKVELAAVEDRVFERLHSWVEEQIGTARQSNQQQAMPVKTTPQWPTVGRTNIDVQALMIDQARPSRGTPPAGPVRFGEVAPAFDGAVDRINNKRKELLGK